MTRRVLGQRPPARSAQPIWVSLKPCRFLLTGNDRPAAPHSSTPTRGERQGNQRVSGSASAHARTPLTFAEQSPHAARYANSQSPTIRSRSIPGAGRVGVSGSPEQVSNSGGGLTATAIAFGPQPASNSVERVIAAISVGLRTFVRSINFAFRLPRRFRRNQVRALVSFLHDPACGFHLQHKIAPLVPVSIDR